MGEEVKIEARIEALKALGMDLSTPTKTKVPTPTQRRVLRALAGEPGGYIAYWFDLGGGVGLKSRSGELVTSLPGISTIDACMKRGWLEYTAHQYAGSAAQIEHRYTLTEAGKEAAK